MATSITFNCFLYFFFIYTTWQYYTIAQDTSGEEANAPTALTGNKKELVPAMFVFGDSLIDNGNNNNIPSFAKANYYPYGIDFSQGPTGRFSNGYTIVDEIAELLGLPLIPAHSQASGNQIIHGVNYASAAAGILDITGRNFVGRIPFNEQVNYFHSTLQQLKTDLGPTAVSQSIGKCIFFIGMGSNDYLNNYLLPNYNTKNVYDGQQYADLLVNLYSLRIRDLYNMGARKFVIAGIGSLACIPSILAQSMQSKCSPEVDDNLVLPFNNNVKLMVNNLNARLPGAKLIYVDIFNMIVDILNRPQSFGFSVVDRGCCGIGRNSGQITCLPFQTPCENRDQYVFWDAFHPTAAVNVVLGKRAFYGGASDVFPINIQQLAMI